MATKVSVRTPPMARPVPDRPRFQAWSVVAGAALGLALAAGARLPGSVGVRVTGITVAFVALVVESLPFLLAGAAIAALLQGRAGRRLLAPAAAHPRLAAAAAPLAGLGLPLCDCGVLPVARILRVGRASGPTVTAFIAGAPLTNPIVILSTLVAFPGSPEVAAGRVAVGLGVAWLAAALIPGSPRGMGEPAASPIDDHHDHDDGHRERGEGRWGRVLGGVSGELVRTGPTLVAGAAVAAVLKTFVPTESLVALSAQPLVGAAAMMLLAFVLSVCSVADAFVAAALPVGPLPRLAFLVMGPMLDIRLAAMYRREFGWRWVAAYAAVVVPSVLVLATAWATWGPR